MGEAMQFKVGDYYTGVCDEVLVVQKGDFNVLQFGFRIGQDFHDYSDVFVGSKVDKGGKTADERAKDDLVSFGCRREALDEGNVMAHIRSVMIGKTIEVEAGEYKGAMQFRGIRRIGPKVILTENPFGRPTSAGGSDGMI